MATITISLADSSIMSNASKAYTISDADLQALLDWSSYSFNNYIQATFNPTGSTSFVPTNQQILLAWIQSQLVDPSKRGVQHFKTVVTVPPPISMT